MKKLAAVAVAITLSACAGTPDRVHSGERGVEPWLAQHAPIDIEPGAASVRLQYGGIVARNSVQEQDAFCVFEIETVGRSVQTVPPARYRIVGMNRSVETIAALPTMPSAWPAPLNRRVAFGSDEGAPTHLYYKTTFRLQPDAQAGVAQARSLTCMSNQMAPGNASRMRHLTMAEMRDALGRWFSFDRSGQP
jgi:hypothetical protein